MVLKIIGYGFILGPGAYLKDPWNVLDFVIVMSAYLTLLTDLQKEEEVQTYGEEEEAGLSLQSLRAFRVLRPLRAVTSIEGLRLLVQSVLTALPRLNETIIILMFFFVIFAIGGVNLFSGMLKNRCVDLETGREYEVPDYFCGGEQLCPDGYFCGKMNVNPNFEVTNFDNVFWALLVVFQCITLEGWSDVMVMYQKVYTRFVFLFFFLLVFIGAFFLLNLTLAVINSAFTENNRKLKLKKAKEEAERNQFKVKKSSDEAMLDDLKKEDNVKGGLELGLSEFVIAQRAARRMKAWYTLAAQAKEKADKEKEAEQKLMEANEQDKYGIQHGMGQSSTSLLTEVQSPTKTPGNQYSQAQSVNRDAASANIPFGGDKKVGPEPQSLQNIAEQEQYAEDDNHSEQVARFLQDLEGEHMPERTLDVGGGTIVSPPTLNYAPAAINAKDKGAQVPLMSQIDDRRATPDNYNGRPPVNGKSPTQPHPQQNKPLQVKDKGVIPVAGLKGILDDESIVHKELDFEKVIPVQHRGSIDKETLDNQLEASIEEQHPFDLSFIEQINDQHGYMSDGEKRGAQKSLEDFESSAIHSDDLSSFGSEFKRTKKLDAGDVDFMPNRTRNSGLGRPPLAASSVKPFDKRLRRIQTTDFNKNDPMNQTGQSTMFDARESVQHEVFSKLDNKQLKRSPSGLSMGKKSMRGGQSVLSGKQTKNKQQAIDIYKKIDDQFLDKRPKDAHKVIDKKTQKIEINPGIPYISTSQDAVFEIRNSRNARMLGRQVNQYIAIPPAKEGGDDDSEPENVYIRPKMQPYQLKNVYTIIDKQEIVFDDDDEDALILALQPFDTVQNIGFEDMLTHLPTKYVARRSDIIVSSTLSITLTPQADLFESKRLALMSDDEILPWITKRNEFRQLVIDNARLPKKSFQDGALTTGGEESMISIPSLEPGDRMGTPPPKIEVAGSGYDQVSPSQYDSQRNFFDGSQQSPKSGDQNEGKLINVYGAPVSKSFIPNNLLSEPLPDKFIPQMTAQEKKQYNIWREKYKSKQKEFIKKSEHEGNPKQKIYTMAEAKLLDQGKFHEENDEEENDDDAENALEKADAKVNKAVFLTRDNLQNEMKLDQFEEAIQIAKTGVSTEQMKNKLQKDAIPEDLRNELNLPKDMKGFEIDFDEVRIKDSNLKRRKFIWSGQDVLEYSMNKDMSKFVVTHLNKTRIWPKFSFGFIKKARCLLKMFVKTSLFENFMTFCVLTNTIVMAMDKYGNDQETEDQLTFYNSIFTWIFIVEMALKLLAIGPKKYVKEPMNLLDGACVLISIVELSIAAAAGSEGGGGLSAFRTVRVFRTFRVLRVARLLRFMRSMAVIVGVITRSIESFAYIMVLLLLFVFIFALLGMQIYGGYYDFGDELKARANFDSFWIAYVSVFQILTMENWHFNMYESMRTSNPKVVTGIFYIAWIFIGNFVILNLLLSIIFDAFVAEDELDSQDDLAAEQEAERRKQEMMRKEKERRLKKLGQTQASLTSKANMLGLTGAKQSMKKQTQKKTFTAHGGVLEELNLMIDEIEDLTGEDIKNHLKQAKVIKTKDKNWYKQDLDPAVEAVKSLYLFHRRTLFRKLCFNLQKHKYFDRIIMALIFLSSLKLATDTYMSGYDEDSVIIRYSNYTDSTFTWLFFGECVVKIIALGFTMDGGSYIRDSWNQLDFFIVITSMIDFSLGNIELPFIKILRLLRTLRPLRVVSHSKSLRLIVAALFSSTGAIINVSVVVLVVWLMFAIFGINTYKGQFFYCSEEKYFYHLKQTCEEAGYTWQAYDSNFDDIFNALMTLFVVSSLEGWPDIMYQALDIVGFEKGPAFENSTSQAVFFILFILVGAFFFLNFIIGTLFLEYTHAKQQEEAGYDKAMLTWIEIQGMVLGAKCNHEMAYMPTTPWRHKVWMLVTSKPFDYGIMACIVLNMCQMALSYEGASVSWEAFLEFTNYIFTTIFFLECVLKLFAYQRAYFYTNWNRFDFFVVASSLIDVGLKFLPSADGEGDNQVLTVGPQLARVLRVLRVSRVLRLAGKYKGLQALLQTITKAFPAIINVFGLLMLIFFMMATLGVFFFAEINSGDIIGEYKNFKTWDDAFLLLFAISTGEEWNLLMYDCSRLPPDCTEGENCGFLFAWAYYVVFIMLVTHIMLNLFILVIIEQFDKYYLDPENPLQTFQDKFEAFEALWIKQTMKYRCIMLKERELFKFYQRLPPCIGLSQRDEGLGDSGIKKALLKMGIKSEGGFIYFNELLYRLMREKYTQRVRLNTRMTVIELTTQFKLYHLTQKLKGKTPTSGEKGGEEFVSSMKARETSVNPFMTQIFHRISFNTWHNYMLKNEKRKRIREQRQAAGLAADDDALDAQLDETQMEQVQVQREPILVEYTSEEEEQHSMSKHGRSGAQGSGSESFGDDADALLKNMEKTPHMHRLKTRLLRSTAQRRFAGSQFFASGSGSPRAKNQYGKYSKEATIELDSPDPYRIEQLKLTLGRATEKAAIAQGYSPMSPISPTQGANLGRKILDRTKSLKKTSSKGDF